MRAESVLSGTPSTESARFSARRGDLGEALRADVRLHHAVRWPGREATPWTILALALRSRGLWAVAAHRLVSRWHVAPPPGRLRRATVRAAMITLGFAMRVLAKTEIHFDSVFEGGVHLADAGHLYLGAQRVGAGTVIHERVTIGWSLLAKGAPEIGRGVWIGSDTVIAGNVQVGDGDTILPGTVLTRSVPAGCVVQGNPARVVRRAFEDAPLRSAEPGAPLAPGVAGGRGGVEARGG